MQLGPVAASNCEAGRSATMPMDLTVDDVNQIHSHRRRIGQKTLCAWYASTRFRKCYYMLMAPTTMELTHSHGSACVIPHFASQKVVSKLKRNEKK